MSHYLCDVTKSLQSVGAYTIGPAQTSPREGYQATNVAIGANYAMQPGIFRLRHHDSSWFQTQLQPFFPGSRMETIPSNAFASYNNFRGIRSRSAHTSTS